VEMDGPGAHQSILTSEPDDTEALRNSIALFPGHRCSEIYIVFGRARPPTGEDSGG
jgi:hypothetical protein